MIKNIDRLIELYRYGVKYNGDAGEDTADCLEAVVEAQNNIETVKEELRELLGRLTETVAEVDPLPEGAVPLFDRIMTIYEDLI